MRAAWNACAHCQHIPIVHNICEWQAPVVDMRNWWSERNDTQRRFPFTESVCACVCVRLCVHFFASLWMHNQMVYLLYSHFAISEFGDDLDPSCGRIRCFFSSLLSFIVVNDNVDAVAVRQFLWSKTRSSNSFARIKLIFYLFITLFHSEFAGTKRYAATKKVLENCCVWSNFERVWLPMFEWPKAINFLTLCKYPTFVGSWQSTECARAGAKCVACQFSVWKWNGSSYTNCARFYANTRYFWQWPPSMISNWTLRNMHVAVWHTLTETYGGRFSWSSKII